MKAPAFILIPHSTKDEIVYNRKELIRCEDCIHFHCANVPEKGCGWCELISRTYQSNDYCSYGVKHE